MRLTLRFGAALTFAALVVSGAACEFLDEPSQCANDGDCVRFNAICDVRNAVCVSSNKASGDGGTGGVTLDGDVPSSNVDATLPPDCTINPKPVASATSGLGAGPTVDGGTAALVTGNLALGCDKDWTLDNHLIVGNGATLTIAPGTTIRAKAGLGVGIVVQPGGRIVAQGQRNAPVVLTTDAPTPKAGDWRGLFVLGSAPRNGQGAYRNDALLQYGGQNAADSSGSLKFVRVEFAQDGLVLGGVGSGTEIDSVQVRHSNDNCFVMNGGTFNAKHLICQQTVDEQFEIQEGYQGKLQFLFGQRVGPNGADHHGLLVDGAGTVPVIYNATLCGKADAQTTRGHAIVFRNGAGLDANNAIVTGWLSGVDAQSANLGPPLQLRASISFNNAITPVSIEDGGADLAADDDGNFDEAAFFAAGGNATTDPKIVDCYADADPKPWPTTSLTTGAGTPPNDGFFDPNASYIGAFKDETDAWMSGWTRFGAN